MGCPTALERRSLNSTAPADENIGHSSGGGLTPLQRSSRCILQPQPTISRARKLSTMYRGCPRGVVVKAMDRRIIVSEASSFFSRTITFTLG